MTKLSKSIAGKIKKEEIQPDPHWKFLLKHGSFWGLFAGALLIGAVAFSVILFVFSEADFELLQHVTRGRFGGAITHLLVFWGIFFGIFLGLAFYGARHTKKGYRFPLWKLVSANVLGSIILGGIAYGFGGAEHFEHSIGKRIPGYTMFEHHQTEMWSQPEDGLLAGTIVEITEETILILEDLGEKKWEVSLILKRPMDRGIRTDKKLIGRKIKLIGTKTSDSTFEANRILPWKRHRPPFRKNGERPEEHLMEMMRIQGGEEPIIPLPPQERK